MALDTVILKKIRQKRGSTNRRAMIATHLSHVETMLAGFSDLHVQKR
jgi:hypothetical protein